MSELFLAASRDMKAGRFKQAVENYKQLLEADPLNALAYQNLARALNRLNRRDEALEASRRASALDPTLALPHHVQGLVSLAREQFDESESEFRESIRLDPKMVESYLDLAIVLRRKGRMQEAEQVLKEASRIHSKSPLVFSNLGALLWPQGRHGEAIRAYFRALQLEPSFGTIVRFVLVCIATYQWLLFAPIAFIWWVSFTTLAPITLPFMLLAQAALILPPLITLKEAHSRGVVLFLLAQILILLLYLFLLFHNG